MKMKRIVSLLLILYSVLLAGYSIFSYSLTDPNLVLTTWQPYWQFQQWMWQTFFGNPVLLTMVYSGLMLSLFGVYFLIYNQLRQSSLEYQQSSWKYIGLFLLVISPLLVSYNALSHDVFNYIFNAKMLVVYHANPHVQVALDFPDDPWTRFMHNTHTTAPYGYGWTFLSVIPFMLGMGKFLLTWLAFRLWSVLSLVLLYFALQYAAYVFGRTRLQAHQLVLVFLNPLVLIELVSNMHNDLWMIVPAVVGLALVANLDTKKMQGYGSLWLALVLYLFSISIKYATLALLPLFIVLGAEKGFLLKFFNFSVWGNRFKRYVPEHWLSMIEVKVLQFVPFFASVLLFLPLLTSRSQWFLPWYLVWSLVWLPFIRSKMWTRIILLFSFTAMLRYIPWLLTGGFDGNVIVYQRLITFVPLLIAFGWWYRRKQLRKYRAEVANELLGM